MAELNVEDTCLENKQSTAASSSSFSQGSGCGIPKSPGASSPATNSPFHRRTTGPIRRAKGSWIPEEDETLRTAVATYKGKNWNRIAEFFPDRSEVQCLHRWQKVLNPDLVKGPWTQEEDDEIIELVKRYGPTKWSLIAKSLPGRIGKQCRERMSCCGGNCGCGPNCKCGSGCGGCKMYPELSHSEKTTTETLVMGVGPVDPPSGSFEGASEMESGAENGCKCGPSCSCNPCTCK